MNIFSKKLNSKEFEELYNEIIRLRGKITEVDAKLETEITKNNSLRGRLNKTLNDESETINKKDPKYI